MIDVAGGDDIPRKGGPGIEWADLLVINKRDLAPYVGADLAQMGRDAVERRERRPVALLSLVEDPRATPVADWVSEQLARWRTGSLEPAAVLLDDAHHHHGPHAHHH